MSSYKQYLTLCCLTLCCYILPPAVSADELTSSITATHQEVELTLSATAETPVEFNKSYMTGYFTDMKTIATSPARWDRTDWFTAALVTGVAVGLYDNDVKIQKWMLDHKTTTTDNIGNDVTSLGHGKYTPALLGGIYVYGHFSDNAKMRKTALLSVESFVLTGVFVQTLKYAAHRHRPYEEDGSRAWSGPQFGGNSGTMSFPSGHASSAFAVATVIASEYDNYVVPTLAYGVAAVTALNRVTHNAHWSSDIFAGSAIGYFTGKAVVASHQGGKENSVSFVPMIDNSDMGIMLVYKF